MAYALPQLDSLTTQYPVSNNEITKSVSSHQNRGLASWQLVASTKNVVAHH